MTTATAVPAYDSDQRQIGDEMFSLGNELIDLQNAATVALTVLRRALVENAAVTREAIAHEAAVTFGTGHSEASSRLDIQAQRLGVSSLM